MDRFDPFVKYADVYGDIINWEKDPMNKPQNQNKYFFSDGKTYYEQICKMLRLMSVFKEAFNQIYSNEDEISEAWENFVNNLSASVVEGSEPDVTLTWTDDSVNFEFTMVPGVPGEQGVGITSISFNSDYTMTITLSDGNSYTSMSLKGETGPQGPQGETGSGLQILDVYATLADLQSAHPTGQPGDAYQVGSAGNYTLYIWSSSQSAWVPAGTLGTVSPYTSAPLMDGTASAGSQNLYARGDHVHPSDTSRASKEELDALIKTSQSLIDQSFTYRESPAIQDGLARIDKIKGNTIVWNQLIPLSVSRTHNGITWTIGSDGLITVSGTATSSFSAVIITNYATIDPTHKYALISSGDESGNPRFTFSSFDSGNINESSAKFNNIAQFENTGGSVQIRFNGLSVGREYNETRYLQVHDLTQMFGAGNEPTSVEEFKKSLFPLPYYQYNAGELLSFNGTGIKTVSKNQFDTQVVTTSYAGLVLTKTQGTIRAVYSGGSQYAGFNFYGSPVFTDTFLKGKYRLSFDVKGLDTQWTVGLRQGASFLGGGQALAISNDGHYSFTIDAEANPNCYLSFARTGNKTTAYNVTFSNIQLELGTTETSYTPFEEKTISLPISQYFPDGMKSAGNAYDELTPNKAITRIGAVDLGSLSWYYTSGGQGRFASGGISSTVKPVSTNSQIANIKCSKYSTISAGSVYSGNTGIAIDSGGSIWVYDTAYGTDAQAFKQAMNGIMFYFELNEPAETSIDLDMEFMEYENGTEQLLPVNGSVPSTSPIIADMTYLSIDDAMEYIIDKLANVPQNTQQILDALENDVADLQEDVSALQPAVSGLQTSVGNINTNIGQLSSTVAGHTASISDMQSDISDLNTGLSNLEDTVTDNTSRIGTLETGLSATNGNVQSLSSQVQSIDGRVTNLESDLFKIVVKEFDYETVASETNFGTTTPITQEEGYRIIGVVGTEAQAGEYTSPASNIAITQCHVYYTSLGALTITIFGRNNGASSRTNVRIYAYLLCIKDIQ